MGYWGIPIHKEVMVTNPNDPDVSTGDTINKMIALVKLSAHTPVVCDTLNRLLVEIPAKTPSKREIARAIYWFVKKRITFREDESTLATVLGYESDPNQELLIAPITMLQMPHAMGDCDDYSMLVASLLVCAHIPCWFITIAADEKEPNRFSHVYVMAYLEDEGRTITLDASHGSELGWEYQIQYRRAEWFVN